MRLTRAARPAFTLLMVAGAAAAHGTEAAPAGSIPERVIVAVPLLALAALYAAGFARTPQPSVAIRRRNLRAAAAFTVGLLALAAALLSPLAERAHDRFAAHMVQHMLLVVVAAPLLAASAPLHVLARAVPQPRRRGMARAWNRWRFLTASFTHPVLLWVVFALFLWAWHLPPLYDAALDYPALHAFEHASLVVAAVLFWGTVLRPYRPLPGVLGALYLFTTMLHTGVLGALLTFAPFPLYASYLTPATAGLSPLEDQQLAGLIMWIPSGLVMVLLAAALVLRDLERGE